MGMSVFSVLVKSTEKTGIEAAAAAGGKENIGDVPLMGLVPPDLYGHYQEVSGTAVTFTNELPARNAFFESRTFLDDSMPAVCTQEGKTHGMIAILL
jgi:hypothetical protein